MLKTAERLTELIRKIENKEFKTIGGYDVETLKIAKRICENRYSYAKQIEIALEMKGSAEKILKESDE